MEYVGRSVLYGCPPCIRAVDVFCVYYLGNVSRNDHARHSTYRRYMFHRKLKS